MDRQMSNRCPCTAVRHFTASDAGQDVPCVGRRKPIEFRSFEFQIRCCTHSLPDHLDGTKSAHRGPVPGSNAVQVAGPDRTSCPRHILDNDVRLALSLSKVIPRARDSFDHEDTKDTKEEPNDKDMDTLFQTLLLPDNPLNPALAISGLS